jgi:(5-formylfuran-3-yl)methyl phosphate synthase
MTGSVRHRKSDPRVRRPRLLVSVRDRAEATICRTAGVDIVDIKEPAHGSLGRATTMTIAEIAALWESTEDPSGLSVALGEVTDADQQHAPCQIPQQVRWAKLGLAGLAGRSHWVTSWRDTRSRWDAATSRPLSWIAVAYADAQRAASPPVDDILSAAIDEGCAGFLIDTYDKQSGSLTTCVTASELDRWINRAKSAGLMIALAGRLTIGDIAGWRLATPSIFAVRSAACLGQDRRGTVSQSAIETLQRTLATIDAD